MRRGIYRKRSSSRHSWIRAAAPIGLSALVAVAGIALSAYQMRRAAPPHSSALQQSDARKEVLPPNLDGLLSVTTVQELARKAGGSPVTNVDLESRSGLLVYVTTLSDGNRLSFSATSGDALALQDDDKADTAETQVKLPADAAVNTSFEEARKLAQDAFPNGKIRRIKLKADGNAIVLSVKFVDTAQVDINAANGSVIRIVTPTGATAEVPAPEGSPSDSSSHSSPGSAQGAPASENPTSDTGSDSAADNSDNSKKASGKEQIRIEGVLTLANGIYTVTDGDTTYIIRSDRELGGLVDQVVSVKGKLAPGNVVQATKIEPAL